MAPTLLPPPQSPSYPVPGRVQEGGDSGMGHGAGLAGGTSRWVSNGGVDRAGGLSSNPASAAIPLPGMLLPVWSLL